MDQDMLNQKIEEIITKLESLKSKDPVILDVIDNLTEIGVEITNNGISVF